MHKKKQTRTVFFLLVLTVVAFSFFLFWGINEKNIGYFLPRRFTKVLAISVVSYCVAYSSVSFQTITNNVILTPSVMGLESLYLFLQTFVVFFFGARKLSMMTGYQNFLLSVALMVCVAILLFLFLFKGENKNIYFLVLAGTIIGGLFNGLATFMQVLLDPNEFSILQGKMFASLNNVNESLLGICILISGFVLLITIKDYPKLNVLSLGREQAINLGIHYKALVLKTLIITSVLVSISTALVGPITFLGILVVSISRSLMKTYQHSKMVIASTLLSCFVLTIGLIVVEKLFRFDTTVSVIVNLFGGIYFIYLIIKENKK